ncbi:hypothetical protein GGF31_001465 [Allomyces arbusculus]|nr:hypothetical protein GGF31_001465 [Allomyces arbusculus]
MPPLTFTPFDASRCRDRSPAPAPAPAAAPFSTPPFSPPFKTAPFSSPPFKSEPFSPPFKTEPFSPPPFSSPPFSSPPFSSPPFSSPAPFSPPSSPAPVSTPTATSCLTPISTRPRVVTPAQQRALAELDAHMWSVPPPNSRFETLTRPTPAHIAPSPPPSPPTTADEFAKSACALIEKILDLGTVRMDSKVADFLETDGVLPLFVNYLTRIPAESDEGGAESATTTEKMDRNADLVPTMRSYHVMEMLSATHPVNAQFADRHLAEIVTLLLDALAPNSDANLYHFAKVLETLVKRWTVRVIDRLVYTTRANPPLLRLVPHLDHPAVSAVLLTCLLHAAPENPRERAMRFSHLDDTGFLDALVNNLDSSNELLACATVDFLRQLVEEGMRCDNCNDLFRALTTRPAILDHLLDLIEHGKPYQRRAVVAFLHALVVKMIPKPPTTMSSSFGQGDSSLTILAASIAHSLVPALSILTDYVARCPALSSTQHLTALELLLPVMNAASTQDLERHVAAAFWHHLAETALVTCPTAVILAVYYRLIHGLLGRGSVALVRAALVKPKVMLRLIGYYISGTAHVIPVRDLDPAALPPPPRPRTDLHAYALLILNLVRLTAAARGPQSYLGQVWAAHGWYAAFEPILRRDTASQVVPLLPGKPWAGRLGRRPVPHVVPDPVKTEFVDRGCFFLPPGTVALTPDQHVGVDLGSKYAICLGFPVVVARPAAGNNGSPMSSAGKRTAAKLPCSPPLTDDDEHDQTNHRHRHRRGAKRKSRAALFAELAESCITVAKKEEAEQAPLTPEKPALSLLRRPGWGGAMPGSPTPARSCGGWGAVSAAASESGMRRGAPW